jgi:hypothetical protein
MTRTPPPASSSTPLVAAPPEPATANANVPSGHTSRLGDFDQAMRQEFSGALKAQGLLMLVLPLLVLLAAAGIGHALRLLPWAWLGTLLTAAPAVVVLGLGAMALRTAHRSEPFKNVDWASADTYRQQLEQKVPPGVGQTLAWALAQVQHCLPHAVSVHPWVARPGPEHQKICTIDTSAGCACAMVRITSAVRVNRSRPILVIGDRLLDHPAALEYVLAHETHHVRRPWLHLRLFLGWFGLLGWLAVGLVLPPAQLVVIAPLVWLATMVLRWADQIAADIAAARITGAGAARAYWDLVRAAHSASAGRSGWRSRLLRVSAAVMMPTHPPSALRSGISTRIGSGTDRLRPVERAVRSGSQEGQ